MKLWSIAKTVGSAMLQVALPGTGTMIIDAVNEILPDDKKLPVNATGTDVDQAVASLPPDKRAALIEKEFDVEVTYIKESNSTVRSMLENDAKNPHSTRPYIAKGAFHVVAFSVIVGVSMWAFGVFKGDKELVKAVMDGWQFVLAVIGPLVVLLWAYFGVLKQENKDRLNAANNIPHSSLLSDFVKKIGS